MARDPAKACHVSIRLRRQCVALAVFATLAGPGAAQAASQGAALGVVAKVLTSCHLGAAATDVTVRCTGEVALRMAASGAATTKPAAVPVVRSAARGPAGVRETMLRARIVADTPGELTILF